MTVEHVKYMYVEVIRKKEGSAEVVGGLFKGIIKRRAHDFIVLGNNEDPVNKTHILNMHYYDTLMVEVLDDEYKTMLFLTADTADQEAALKVIQGHYDKFVAAGMILQSDDGIIDVNKYTEVPKDYRQSKPVDTKTADKKTTTATNYSKPANEYGSCAYNRPNHYVAKEIKPYAFESKTVPSKAVIEEMISMTKAVTNGTFTFDIPHMSEDGVAIAGAKTFHEEGIYY